MSAAGDGSTEPNHNSPSPFWRTKTSRNPKISGWFLFLYIIWII